MYPPAPTRSWLRIGLSAASVLLLLAALAVFPAAARTDMEHIQSGDKIFLYEENLDLTGLRTGANPVTSLRKYTDDNPAKAVIREAPVQDDTAFSPTPALFGDQTGIFYAYNPTDGVMHSLSVTMPSVSVQVVLADPYHADIVTFPVTESTRIAFEITSTDVGTAYHAGTLYPATVDLVLTTPGGGQLTFFQGKDFSRMNLSTAVFYTDDPGKPGAIDFEGLEGGSYSVQARWRDPASFDRQAPDSNIVSFTVGRRAPAPATPQTAVTVVTTVTTVLTPVPTTVATPPATSPSPEITTPAPTAPPATPSPAGTTVPEPTAAPGMAVPAILAPALAALLFLRDRKGR